MKMNEQIREQLKNYGERPLMEEQKKSLMKVSKKGFAIIAIVWAAMLFFLVKEGMELLGFSIGLGVFFTVLILLFELRDTLKLKGFDEIYIVPVYVEQPGIAYRGNRRVQGQYYDFKMYCFCPIKFNMERMDPGYYELKTGSVVLTIMGRKGSEFKFFCVKPEKL